MALTVGNNPDLPTTAVTTKSISQYFEKLLRDSVPYKISIFGFLISLLNSSTHVTSLIITTLGLNLFACLAIT